MTLKKEAIPVCAVFDIGKTNSAVTPVFLKGTLGEATNLTFDLRENYNIFCSIVPFFLSTTLSLDSSRFSAGYSTNNSAGKLNWK